MISAPALSRALRRQSSAVLILAALSAFSARAHAADEAARAKESFKAGAAAYAAGEYLAAIQALESAYELMPLPAIAFSLAQAERKQYFVSHESAHLTRSIRLFRQYLREVPSGGRRADALEALSQLELLEATKVRAPRTDTQEVRAAQPARVLISAEAPSARISLDGAPAVPAPLIREVTPGKHRVEVQAPGFESGREEVLAVTGELTRKDVVLRERPARLGIWAPPDSELYVDGSYVSPGGAGVTLAMAGGKHRIALLANGHKISYRDVTLQRGSAQSLRLTLEPTAQRNASYVLFIAGSAALGAGLITSALAVQAENRAEYFLGQRGRRNVEDLELSNYKAAVNSRNTLQIATGVSLGAALGMFITGLFLHELDAPDPERARRDGNQAPARPRRRPDAASVRIHPEIGFNQLGAVLNVSL